MSNYAQEIFNRLQPKFLHAVEAYLRMHIEGNDIDMYVKDVLKNVDNWLMAMPFADGSSVAVSAPGLSVIGKSRTMVLGFSIGPDHPTKTMTGVETILVADVIRKIAWALVYFNQGIFQGESPSPVMIKLDIDKVLHGSCGEILFEKPIYRPQKVHTVHTK